MSTPYKPTLIGRQTLCPLARIILRQETDAPKGSYRKVQIIVPPSPEIFAVLDVAPQRGFSEDGVGIDRNYPLPALQPGQRTEFKLLPEQFLTMSSITALAHVTIICEYLVP
jgi:hypothetical protein